MTNPLDRSTVPSGYEDVANALRTRLDEARTRLEELIRIPSISAAGHDPTTLDASAAKVVELLTQVGFPRAQILQLDGAPPFVFGEWLGLDDAPTVLLYAHHDVQPIPRAEAWTSPPFEPTERNGRLYARGASDDKGGLAVHLAAVDAWAQSRGRPPVNIKVIVEGEEEVGSPNMEPFLAAHGTLLQADVVVICDSGNWETGWPTITYSTRGLAEVYVTLTALNAPLHSGGSGPIPDALSAMMAALASLKDGRGGNAVRGLADDARRLDESERARLRELEASKPDPLDGALFADVQTVGDPTLGLYEREWMQPAVTVIGIDVPSVTEATNQLLDAVRAKISIRLAPGQDPDRAAQLVADHIRAHVPWGLACDIEFGAGAWGWVTEPSGPWFEAAKRALTNGFGREPALVGIGGTLPLMTLLERTLNKAPILLTAIGDPQCRAHGTDESMDLGDFACASLSETLLLGELATI